jgi:hypothetical protein
VQLAEALMCDVQQRLCEVASPLTRLVTQSYVLKDTTGREGEYSLLLQKCNADIRKWMRCVIRVCAIWAPPAHDVCQVGEACGRCR